jgi:hypothetical protein
MPTNKRKAARCERAAPQKENQVLDTVSVPETKGGGKNAPLFTAAATPETKRAEAWLKARLQRARVVGSFNEDGILTPELAELLLALNVGNRPQRRGRVSKMAQVMREGRWMQTHQGVAVGNNDVMVDGQHRLLACIEAGIPIPMRFEFGCDPDTYKVLDTQVTRSPSDTLYRAGHVSTAALSASAILLHQIENGGLRSGVSRYLIANDQIEAFVAARPELADAVRLGDQMRYTFRSVSQAAFSAAFALILRRHSHQTASDFCDAVKTGLNLSSQRDPVFVLRKEIQDNWIHGARKNVPRGYLSAAVIKAFNAWVKGKTIRSVRMQDRESFPDVER